MNAVQGVLKALNLDIPVAGLAKRDEEIWLPGASSPVCLPKRSDALRLLQRVRDETHRFATSRNQALRTKENIVSVFLEIPNVGEKRARLLTKKFMTVENLCNAEVRRKKIQEKQMQSLKTAGTTVQTAAEAQYIEDLADSALN